MKLKPWQTQVRPVRTRIAVEPIESPKQTEGGILLPDGCAEGIMRTGRVFAVGPGEMAESGQRLAIDVNPGDVVQFAHSAQLQDMVYDGHKFWCVDERDVQFRIVEANNDDDAMPS